MEVYCKGISRIRHSATGEIYEIQSDQLEWEAVDSDMRPMGQEVHYQAVLDHAELGELTWDVWEYPVGIENHRATRATPHEVIKNFDFGLDQDKPEADQWLDYSLPDNPFTIFMDSYHHTGDLLADHGRDEGAHLLNRMVFSHQVTALEAYLGDTLMKEVMSDEAARQRLIEQDDDLAKDKFTLAQISQDRGLVERKVREHLRSIVYHNLARVDVLYNIALRIKILNLANDRSGLFKAVILRHDCVHRNGFDEEGNKLTVFTKSFVQATADLIKDFVNNIEKAVRARLADAS